jgi:hypothetical protein
MIMLIELLTRDFGYPRACFFKASFKGVVSTDTEI